jgi:hypothetical protein
MLRALFQTRGDTRAEALKGALENLDKPYVGVVTTYDRPFSTADHDAFSLNMIWLGAWRQGRDPVPVRRRREARQLHPPQAGRVTTESEPP